MGEYNHIKQWFNVQLTMVQQVSPIVSLLLLVANVSLSAFTLIAWRNIPSYIGIPLIILAISLAIWGFSRYYTYRLEMNRFYQKAAVMLNPYGVDTFSPVVIMMWLHRDLPMMEALYSQTKDPKLKKEIDLIKGWLDNGKIPLKDFPSEVISKYRIKESEGL